MKKCTQCGFECPLEDAGKFFHKNRNSFQSSCKECEKVRNTLISHSEAVKKNRINNPGKANEASLKWAKRNPDKRAIKQQRYRARKKEMPDDFTKEDLEFALIYWDNKCPNCNVDITDNYHLDHHVPISWESCPGTVPSNVVPLCSLCNTSKGNQSPQTFYRLRILKRIENFFLQVRLEDD